MSDAFEMFAGDNARLTGTVVQQDGVTPQNLTGYTVSFIGPDFTVAGVVDVAAAGTFHIDIPKTATPSYLPGFYAFKIRILSGALDYTVLSARFRILKFS